MFEDKQYSNGSELCVESDCIRCEEGEWKTSEFDIGCRY